MCRRRFNDNPFWFISWIVLQKKEQRTPGRFLNDPFIHIHTPDCIYCCRKINHSSATSLFFLHRCFSTSFSALVSSICEWVSVVFYSFLFSLNFRPFNNKKIILLLQLLFHLLHPCFFLNVCCSSSLRNFYLDCQKCRELKIVSLFSECIFPAKKYNEMQVGKNEPERKTELFDMPNYYLKRTFWYLKWLQPFSPEQYLHIFFVLRCDDQVENWPERLMPEECAFNF